MRHGNCHLIRDGKCCPFDHEPVLQSAGWKADKYKQASARDPAVDDMVMQWDTPWERQPQRFEMENQRKQALAYAYRHGIKRLVVRADVWRYTFGGPRSHSEWQGKSSFNIEDIRQAYAHTEADVHELGNVDISELEKAENERAPLPRKVRFDPGTSRSASSSHRSALQWSDNRSRDEEWQYGDYDERRNDDPWVGQSSSGSGYRHEETNRRSRGYGRHKDYDDRKRSTDRDDHKRRKDYDRHDSQ